MIIFLFGFVGTGKTYFLRMLSNNFIEFTYFDDVDVAKLLDVEHVVYRDAGSGSIVILAIANKINPSLIHPIATRWAENFPIQYLQTLNTPLPKQ